MGSSSVDRAHSERGFTLIELMVVVLIIGILIAVALPTFLGARNRANNRQAQSNLRNGVVAAKIYAVTNGSYDPPGAPVFNVASAQAIEPALTWSAGAGVPPVGQVRIGTVTVDQVTLRAQSASGTQFCIADDWGPPGTAGTVTGIGTPNTNWAQCDARPNW